MTPKSTKRHGARLPIVFVGPSLSLGEARDILDADYRPPIRRGDLEKIPSGSVVAIIDGVFDQDLSVSISEIRSAIDRDVRVFGASSIGALRAAEVPGVHGVGRIYEMFRDGIIDGDDEVALVFDPQTMRPLCEPLVNIRHAVERIATPGTISRDLASKILRVARRLHYTDRAYPHILKKSGLIDHREASHLADMLASYDLKKEDAVTLLEQLRELEHGSAVGARRPSSVSIIQSETESNEQQPQNASVHCWEFGYPLPFSELVSFLALTGKLLRYAAQACAFIEKDEAIPSELSMQPSTEELHGRLLAQTARAWHWSTEEEVAASLRDLGLEPTMIEAQLSSRADKQRRAMSLIRARSYRALAALRVELFLDDLALKRETARALSLDWLARRSKEISKTRLSNAARQAAEDKICQMLDVRDLDTAMEQLGWWGISSEAVRHFIGRLAFARRLLSYPLSNSRTYVRRSHIWLRRSPKVTGSRRFCTSMPQAYSIVKRLQPVIGITRVAMITGLRAIGIPNAQAFRPDGEWSSTVGSGKSESALGARVGAIMEEIEKWAQEQFARRDQSRTETVGSFKQVSRRANRAIDPATLDLPYDTCYAPDLEIAWYPCVDLVQGSSLLVPTAAVTHRRVFNDIYYSSRGGRKTVTTNGLASGMMMAEAITHALCEYIERHAMVVDSVIDGNPGTPTRAHRRVLDLETVPRSTRRLVTKISSAGCRLFVRDITSDIKVSTFNATIFLPEGSIEGTLLHDGWRRASGWAAHPDPETAVNMAIMEASQTIMTHVAGAREDLVLKARSLGRHERTASRQWEAVKAEMGRDVPRRAFSDVPGLSSNDAAEDVRWILNRLTEAGYNQALVIDYSTRRISPVRVVRAIIPGLETINPFHTGYRARVALLSDMLPALCD
jgi:ribosomal protein S12 methylthiotransferase accessory factor